jgi:WD40 repeat protein/type II secretory pathway predicted ATPase ExeA
MFFLSYASRDVAVAKALARGLGEAGLEVWCDELPKAMVPGRLISEQLEEKLRQSQGLLVLVGSRGVDRWVRAEVDISVARNIGEPTYPLVPLLFPEASLLQLPAFLARFHAVRLEGDVTRWSHQEFQTLARRLEPLSPWREDEDADTQVSPFPGLESFGEDQARFYFGRDREIREAVARLGRNEGHYRRWLEVEGPSGAGKSSFVKAGLVPAIRGGWVEGAPAHWRVAILRPGKDPVHRLAQALVRAFQWQDKPGQLREVEAELRRHPQGLRDLVAQTAREDEGFLLVVDQLEETFALSEGNPDIPRHLGVLLLEALESEGPLHLITTLRSDFLGHLGEHPSLARALNARWTSRYYLPPMDEEGLRQALQGPAHLARLHWEEGLAARLTQDAQEQSGGLPLVAHVLRELWERREGRKLLHSTYEELGLVAGALTRGADALLATFSPEERERARRLMLALVKVGHGTKDVRRTLSLEESRRMAGGGTVGHELLLRLSGGRAHWETATQYAPMRLLSVQEDRVELIHEALLEQWKTLRGWMEAHRQELERQEDLEASARLWEKTGEIPGEAHLRYLRSVEPVSTLARSFLDAVDGRERQRRYDEQSRELASLALQEPASWDPQLSLRLILEAHRFAPNEQTVDALLRWYQRRLRLQIGSYPETVSSAVFSTDGQRLLGTGKKGVVRLLDASSGRPLAELQRPVGRVTAMALSPDGQQILIGRRNGIARLWDVKSGQCLFKLTGHTGPVHKVAFSPDGRHLLTASEGGTVRLWEAAAGRVSRKLKRRFTSVNTLLFSPDGSRVLITSHSGQVQVWDIALGRPCFTLQVKSGYECVAAFSPDGQRVLVADWFGASHVHDAATGQPLLQLQQGLRLTSTIVFTPDGQRIFIGNMRGEAGFWETGSGQCLTRFEWPSETVLTARFSAAGSYIITSGHKETAHLRDASSGELLGKLQGSSGDEPIAATFSPTGQRLLTMDVGDTASVWEVMPHRLRAELHAESGGLFEAEFSVNGQRLLAGVSDGKSILWDTASGRRVTELHGHARFSPDGQRLLATRFGMRATLWEAIEGQRLAALHEESGLRAATFSSEGRYIFTAHKDGAAFLWNGSSGQLLTRLPGNMDSVKKALFSPDSQHLLTGDSQGRVCLWNVASGQPVLDSPRHFTQNPLQNSNVTSLEFSPDGSRFLTGGGDRRVLLWETRSGQLLLELGEHYDFITHTLFCPDGQRILTAEWEGTARLWSATSGRRLARLHEHRGLLSATFSRDGRYLLTSSTDKTARLWDAQSGRPITEYRGHSDRVSTAVFSPNGQFVLTASRDQTARICEPATPWSRTKDASPLRLLTPPG